MSSRLRWLARRPPMAHRLLFCPLFPTQPVREIRHDDAASYAFAASFRACGAAGGSVSLMTMLREVTRIGSLITVDQEAPVLAAVRAMAAHDVRIVGVLAGNRLAGVFSERDVVRRVVARELDPARTRLGDVMTESILVADSEDDCAETLRRMETAGIGHMPVLAEGHVLSMVSIRDLLGTEQGRAAASRLKGVAEI